MIKYQLVCKAQIEGAERDAHPFGREFECWFPSSAGYDEQAARGLVVCPTCHSPDVAKAMMAPSVARSERRKAGDAQDAQANPADAQAADANAISQNAPLRQDVALADEKLRRLNAMVRELRTQILERTRDVGAGFPEEARKMHAGQTEEAPIRGQASSEEARALIEEGIAILPIPILPEDRN